MSKLTIRYYAGARAATGVEEEAMTDIRSVGEALRLIEERHRSLAGVLPACSLLLNGVAVHDRTTTISHGHDADSGDTVAMLDVLPPFAGG